jgi:hypothetical protein
VHADPAAGKPADGTDRSLVLCTGAGEEDAGSVDDRGSSLAVRRPV